MKKVLFLSNMIVQPIGKELGKSFDVSYADLDSFVQTLTGETDSDYLVMLFDSRFFFELFPESDSGERLRFLGDLLKTFREKNRCGIVLGNLFEIFPSVNTTQNIEEYIKLLSLNREMEVLKEEISDLEVANLFDLGIRKGSENFMNQNNRFLFQSPFTRQAAKEVAGELARAITRLHGKRKKVLVLDGDNTLWGGIVGEDGVEGVACDENYPGIAYKRFQLFLKKLKESGIVLAMVSKNNRADVEELFEKRRMPLRLDDFVTVRINWLPKSQNIRSIADELNLGLESFLFVDDNPFEIEEVKNAVPQVDGLLFDKENPLGMIEKLSRFPGVAAHVVTQEDRVKSEQYKSEKKRSEVFRETGDLEAFIKQLNIEITWWKNNKKQLSRITQLINKTNQFNLTTRRYTQAEVEEMMEQETVLSFKVEDRFGDMGIVGVMIIKECRIDTFLLSCRVLGRGIEERIIDAALEVCGDELRAEYIPSAKNSQVENLYERLGFAIEETEPNGIKRYRFKQRNARREYIKMKEGDYA